MPRSPLAPLTLEGWYILHQFLRLPPAPADDEERSDAEARARGLADWLSAREDLGADGWSGLYRIVGGHSDYLLVHFRSTLDALGEAERELRRLPWTRGMEIVHDYVSVTELGMYNMTNALLKKAESEGVEPGSGGWDEMARERLESERSKDHVQSRLYPTQPENMPYVCFYPMDKRRKVGQNWYSLPVEDRAALMRDHGMTGRRYAGRISQIISGSVGFDDWEWAVTLFAPDPMEFKNLITEMRYDEVSAVYAEFGEFWVGHRVPTEALKEELGP
ncbi:MAG: hydrogen peroxide-dependent heme synthase [Gemmatimonadota bacterium]